MTTRFYQMDKLSLQDHIGKIRAALCDKGGRFVSASAAVPCVLHAAFTAYAWLYLLVSI
jgi:hypothetical protein